MILSSPFSDPVRLEVKGSLATALLVVLPLVLVACVVVFYTPWPWYLLCIPAALLIAIGFYYLRLHYWQLSKHSVLEINQDEDKQWAILVDEKWHLVDLLPNSYVSPFLIVLNFKGKVGRLTAILPADSLDKETHRRLRVRIRMAFS